MAKKPLKGFPKSDAQKMLDRLSAPRVLKKYADGGLASLVGPSPVSGINYTATNKFGNDPYSSFVAMPGFPLPENYAEARRRFDEEQQAKRAANPLNPFDIRAAVTGRDQFNQPFGYASDAALFNEFYNKNYGAPELPYGFQAPSPENARGPAQERFVNSRTGEVYYAPSGGYTNPNSDWTTNPFRVLQPNVPATPAAPVATPAYGEPRVTPPPTYQPPPSSTPRRAPIEQKYNRNDMYDFIDQKSRLMAHGGEVQKYADGGLTSAPVVIPEFTLSKDKAKQKELQGRIDAYKKQVEEYNAALAKYNAEVYDPYKTRVNEYNTALEKYNAEIYSPYQAKVDEYNRAAEAYNRAVEEAAKTPDRLVASKVTYGPGWLQGGYIPWGATNPGQRQAMPSGGYFVANPAYGFTTGNVGDIYIRGAAAPAPFTMQAPTAPAPLGMEAPKAPDPFGMQQPTSTLTQEEVDAFAAEAKRRAEENAAQRKTAMRAIQDPSRYNLGSFGVGDISGLAGQAGLAGSSVPLFKDGGEVSEESMASKMLKDVVPLDTRTFVSTLFGNRDPITEQNLSSDQMTALREVIQTAEQKGRKGNVQYADYSKFKAGPQHNPHISLENTLGRFNYTQNPDGSITVTDRYDFVNPEREEAIKAYEGMGPARKALEVAKRTLKKPATLPLTLASELGNAYIGREGRDVKIQLPPSESKKMLDGVKKPQKK